MQPLKEIRTVYKEGAWHFRHGKRRDNIGDFTMGVAVVGDQRWYLLMARMGTPPPGGAMWYAPYGDPYSGWTQGAPPGSMPQPPTKSLPGPAGSINIDTHCWVQNPGTKVFTWVHGVKDRARRTHLERATSSAVDPRPQAYERFAEDLVGYPSGEPSIVIDPWLAEGFLFYVKKTTEPPDPYGVRFRSRVWRRPIDLEGFDTSPILGEEEMVFSPDQDGQGEWGTAHTVLQPGICILPDRTYLMAALGKIPFVRKNGLPAKGKSNATAAVGLWRSWDQGRTWKPLEGNPIFSREYLGLVEGLQIANRINSPHPWYDPFARKLYVAMQLGREGQVNKPGSRLMMTELEGVA